MRSIKSSPFRYTQSLGSLGLPTYLKKYIPILLILFDLGFFWAVMSPGLHIRNHLPVLAYN